MKRSLAALAASILAVFVLAGCNETNNTFQNNTGATIVSISPSTVTAQGGDFLLTVNASALNGFLTTSVIEWNGTKMTTTYVDAVTLTATIPAADIAKPGLAYVNTFTPQSGTGKNGLSNVLSLPIYGPPNPVPVVTSVSPATATACGTSCSNSDLNITITGSDFLPTSTNGQSIPAFTSAANTANVATGLTVSSISSTEIKATIPGKFLANADAAATVTVINPPSAPCLVNCPNLGGGTSKPVSFTITGTGAAAVAAETPAISESGRFVAFTSPQHDTTQILLRDTCLAAPAGCVPQSNVVSVASDGTSGNKDSQNPAITPDGRYIAFSSAATNLTENAPAGRQVYLRDTCFGAASGCKASTTLISVDESGALTGTEAILPSISSNGRYVAFVSVTPASTSTSSKLSPAAAALAAAQAAATGPAVDSGMRQVFVRDTCLGASSCTPKTTRISLQPGEGSGATKPAGPAISGLARQIALPDGRNSTVFTHNIPLDERASVAESSLP